MENSRASCGVRLSVSVFGVFRCVAESSAARVLRRDRVRGLLRVVKEQLGGTAASLSVAGIPSTVVFGVRVPAAAHASGCALEKHPCNRSIPGVMDYGLIIAQSTDAGERGTKPLCGDACVQFDVRRAGGMANGASRAAHPTQPVLFAAMSLYQNRASCQPDEVQFYDQSPMCTAALSIYLGYLFSTFRVRQMSKDGDQSRLVTL